MENKHEKPKQREFVQDILCNNKEAIYGYNKAIKDTKKLNKEVKQ